MTVRIGLVGYGIGGRLFHAPYLRASEECDLVAVVARSEDAVRRARVDDPGIAIHPSLTSLLDAGVDAVVISTPPHTRRDLVLEAIGHDTAVVADKPFAPTAAEGRLLADRARDRGVLLNVFHNRRRDTDIVTALEVIDSGRLGTVRGPDLRFDLDEPESLEAGLNGGLLRDLGSHVVDQALHLLGPARAVTARMVHVDTASGRTNAGFAIEIEHESGALSHISASKINHLVSKEVRLYGDCGSYVSDYTDVQTAAIRRGERPWQNRRTWGFEQPDRWGILRTDGGETVVPSAQGDYTTYYDEFARAAASGGPGPVPAEEGVAVLQVLDAIVRSDRERRHVMLEN
ncbi:MAG TPA: Gfo/Idh/MocA family oxidoreductase [Microbacterium sp.]|uniref:Gfo/Idh/MocA family protein n=1 Tax=Microbacterium sp. TaxID=51671 RepID=UPI002B49B742|nr:Gfo/Idh/MocA family oxidoreductase [Microbacterium sp.]HKT57468.1 Gfo/Idh/MocA family oxidoreductase [Microbacterium sp.]